MQLPEPDRQSIKSLYEEARKHLANRNFGQALAICEQVLAQDPEEAVFRALKLDIQEQQRQEISARILEVDRQVQAEPDLDRRVAILEEAVSSFPGEAHLERALRLAREKRELVRSLVAKARRHEECGQFAEALSQWRTLGAVYPQYPGLSSEMERVAKRREEQAAAQAGVRDRKRDEIVAQTFLRARDLRAAGDLAGALAEAEQALAAHPGEPRLTQLRDVLARELQRARAAQQAPAAVPPAGLPSGLYPAAGPVEPAPPAVPPITAPQAMPAAPPPVVSPPTAPKAARKLRRGLPSKPVLAAVAGGVMALAVIIAGVSLLGRRTTSSSVALIPIEIRTTPPGAGIRVDGELRGVSDLKLSLAPGTYQIEAQLEGYQSGYASLQLSSAPAPPLHLVLEPLAASLRVVSDLDQGKVVLDAEAPRDLQEGQFTLDGVAAGKHTLKVSGRDGEATITFETAPAALPIAAEPVTRNLAVVVVAGLGSRARLYASFGPAAVELDGQPAGQLEPGGLELSGLSPGTHEIVLDSQRGRRKMIIDTTPAPVLTAYLQSDRDVGTLVVLTGEDGVRVFLNGREQRRTTTRGQLRISNLPVREYAVQVAKDGFEEVPAQKVTVRKNEETKLEFRLRPVARASTLAIRGAPPGAQVLLDGREVGTVQDDGSFTHAGILPGEHQIELRRPRFAPRVIRRDFSAGQTVQLSAGEVSLERLPGRLQVQVTPGEASLAIGKPGEALRPISGAGVELPEGSYIVVARAPDYAEASQTVQITAGETQTVKFELTRLKPAAAAPAARPVLWGSGWTEEGGWLFRRGGNYVLAPIAPVKGRLAFSAVLRKGRRLRWVVGYSDERNHDLFEMDKRWLYHTVVRNGRKSERPKVAHELGEWQHCTLQIEVSEGAIVHRVRKGEQWVTVSQTAGEPGRDYTQGRFGFYIPGDDQIGISNFTFTAR